MELNGIDAMATNTVKIHCCQTHIYTITKIIMILYKVCSKTVRP